MAKLNIAVAFGGASQEHDVSVVTAQQMMDAVDSRHYQVTPVYCDFQNRLFTGPALRDLSRFRPRPPGLTEVVFAWDGGGPCLRTRAGNTRTPIDCVVPAFHGPFGEDGRFQGMTECIGIPTTGFSATHSALAMRKDATKALVASVGVNVLPHVAVNHADMGGVDSVVARVEETLAYPAIVKPANLGSSIGVGVATDRDTLIASIQHVLRLDSFALVEPRVNHLQEYNVALIHRDDEIVLSAIERPKSSADLLDFKEKYLAANDGEQQASKLGSMPIPSQGMLSLTRDINPDITDSLRERIDRYARAAFSVLGLRGAPRIDFMYDSVADELWFNEINPIPGSFGFFLWEAASPRLLFPELIDHLVAEALHDSVKTFDDPVPEGAYLLSR
ncbi:MAG: D-alanine--D-alanine ligase [Pseudomonadota bacterium]